MAILVIIEKQNGTMHRISREVVAGGQVLAGELNQPLNALVIGNNIQSVVDEAAKMQLNEIIAVEHDLLTDYSAEAWTAAIQQVAAQESPEFILAGLSYQMRDYGPKLSARLRQPMLSDVASFSVTDGRIIFHRTAFNGKLQVNVKVNQDSPSIVSFQSAAFQSDQVNSGQAPVRKVAVTLTEEMIQSKPEAPFQESGGDVDLSSAGLIVSVGRGIGKQENIPLAEALAKALGAEVGSSRPIVDAGWLPKARQVGSSGQSVTPNLYLALGISGAIQHVVGMKGSKTIIAINKDAEAPIFEVADYGVVGDIMEIVPKLTEALQQR